MAGGCPGLSKRKRQTRAWPRVQGGGSSVDWRGKELRQEGTGVSTEAPKAPQARPVPAPWEAEPRCGWAPGRDAGAWLDAHPGTGTPTLASGPQLGCRCTLHARLGHLCARWTPSPTCLPCPHSQTSTQHLPLHPRPPSSPREHERGPSHSPSGTPAPPPGPRPSPARRPLPRPHPACCCVSRQVPAHLWADLTFPIKHGGEILAVHESGQCLPTSQQHPHPCRVTWIFWG